jgi:hypothetical protein
MRRSRLVIPFAAARKKVAESSHSAVKKPLNSKTLNELSGVLALDGAVAMATASAMPA